VIPELALETKLNLSRNIALNDEILLQAAGIDIPTLTVHFEPV
jgi:hypothetical protein